VTKPELLNKLQTLIDDAERTRMFGSIEMEIRDGRPTVIRTTKTDRLDGENPHHGTNKHIPR
jgi:hypothetical protein